MEWDLAVIGAGTAGAALAGRAARAGMRVVCLERRSLDDAGARWVNGVPEWMFAEAGIAPPRGPERVAGGHAFHLVAGWGPTRVTVRDHDVLDVDMRLLVARLQRDAREAGAELRGGVSVFGEDGRSLATSDGPVRARWVVDASGLTGARLLAQPRVEPADLCAAAQEVRRVSDMPAARAFFARNQADAGDTLCFTGVAGGYSIVNVRLEEDTVSLLSGAIPALGHPSGARLIAQFAAEHPWVGATVFGGARAIPLRRPHEVLARDRVALVGDAACQVFSTSGSGIGIGLVAARMLADALESGGGPRAYGVAFQRRWGGLLAGYDLLRRFSQELGPRDLARMMRTGLLDPAGMRAGLEQKLPAVTAALVLGRLVGAVRAPRTAARLAQTVARMGATQAVFAGYPSRAIGRGLWSRVASGVAGS